MTTTNKQKVTIEVLVNAPVSKVWQYWTEPRHITKWNCASNDWHSPRAENDVKTGGKFNIRMEAKDGSFGFDFFGVYTAVEPQQHIAFTMGDDRKVTVDFEATGNQTKVIETFEAEQENPVEMQRSGWQSILNNFKNYAENN